MSSKTWVCFDALAPKQALKCLRCIVERFRFQASPPARNLYMFPLPSSTLKTLSQQRKKTIGTVLLTAKPIGMQGKKMKEHNSPVLPNATSLFSGVIHPVDVKVWAFLQPLLESGLIYVESAMESQSKGAHASSTAFGISLFIQWINSSVNCRNSNARKLSANVFNNGMSLQLSFKKKGLNNLQAFAALLTLALSPSSE